MSFGGIDLGSSSVKIAAYNEEGKLLGLTSQEINPLHPQPGWWETDPEDVWRATRLALQELMLKDNLHFDPMEAISISASGRENFPADANGKPLGNTLMGADIRGEEFEIPPEGVEIPESWSLSCGHLRERMDPVMRLMWWRKNHPEIYAKMKQYPDWHGWLTLKLCGRNVSEHSLVGRWAIYDLRTRTWDAKRLAEYEIPEYLLPEIYNWGEVIGEVKNSVAMDLGLPKGVKVVVGGHDLNCAAIGAGVSKIGSVCLISGSYENMLIPTNLYPTASMLLRGLSITPHLGKIDKSIYAICPTGNAVLNWARGILGFPLEEQTSQLEGRGGQPAPLMALPYLSGAMLYWQGGRKLRGVLLGLTLASTPIDIIQAFMESIAYDHVNTFHMLHEEGVEISTVRAVGGGTRSTWWTQLKSDLLGVPIEVCTQPEPGTFGAALIAGYGLGVYNDLDDVGEKYSGTSKIYQPDENRAKLHQDRMELYNKTVPNLLATVFQNWR